MSDDPPVAKATSLAKTSANLGGIAVIASIFSSFIAFGFGIAAIVTAVMVLKDNPNKPSASQAKLAIASGILDFVIPIILKTMIQMNSL